MPYDLSQDRAQEKASTPYQSKKAVAVTKSDTADILPYAKALYVGTGGDLVIIPVGNRDMDSVTLKNHPTGYVPIQVRRVLNATSASDIVALYD